MAPQRARRRRPQPPSFPGLPHDPLPWLLGAEDVAITAFVNRDLLGKRVDVRALWELREPQRLIGRQQPDGRWCYPTRKPPPYNYDLYETFNTLGALVAKYGLDKRHPAIERGAAYVFSCQAPEGDFRGIYGNQPAHTYTPALMEVLIKAGYGNHPTISRAFAWLLATRQDDGGWAIPARTRDKRIVRDWEAVARRPPIEPDRHKPFSHLVTGMVLRAFAIHPRRRRLRATQHAAQLLKSRLLKPNKYPDRRRTEYWTKFTYPFSFTDLLTALDSFGRLGMSADDPDIARAIDWFAQRQRSDGSFDLIMRRGVGDKRLPLWLGLSLCRALRRFDSRR